MNTKRDDAATGQDVVAFVGNLIADEIAVSGAAGRAAAERVAACGLLVSVDLVKALEEARAKALEEAAKVADRRAEACYAEHNSLQRLGQPGTAIKRQNRAFEYEVLAKEIRALAAHKGEAK
jgi:hypothetical protein